MPLEVDAWLTPVIAVTATLGDDKLSDWWNVQAVIWVLFVGELSAAGVDMIGASQFVGWPVSETYSIGHLGLPSGHNLSSGTPFQPQIGAGGNCPEMSMVSWQDGSLNARSWVMKMIIDGLGPDGISKAVRLGARRISALQSGYLYHYAFAMVIGVVGITTWYLFGRAG